MSSKTHPVEELEIMAYLDGELSRLRAAAVAAHLEQCPECQELASGLRGLSHELSGWQIESTDLQITPRLAVALEDFERAQAEAPKQRGSTFRGFLRAHPRWAWGSASAAVLLVVIAVSVPNRLRNEPAARVDRAAPFPDNAPQKGRGLAELDHNYRAEYGKNKGDYEKNFADSTPQQNYTYDSLSRLTEQTPAGNRPQREIKIPTGPMVIRTANLTLTSSDFNRARASLEEILKKHNGYLGQLAVTSSADTARSLEAVLRVPADQLDATLAELKTLGRVESESQKGDEVSQQYVDLEARLSNARNTEQTLLEILRTRTGKLSDVLAVEQEIASVREQIESMQAEKKTLEKQVAFSTVDMKVSEDYRQSVHMVPNSTSTRIRNAAVEGYEMMVAGLIDLLLFLVSWGPSILLWGLILFFPARWLWKRRKNHLF